MSKTKLRLELEIGFELELTPAQLEQAKAALLQAASVAKRSMEKGLSNQILAVKCKVDEITPAEDLLK